MKRSIHVRFSITSFLIFAMLAPFATVALADGKSHFKEGLKYEAAEQWDKAVEEFALAVSDTPKNPEYRLHLTRALFNASQMFMKKGSVAAKEKDYEAAYLAFRRAYAFDPTNELAKSEMDRMVRLQQASVDEGGAAKTGASGVKLVPTGFVAPSTTQAPQIPQRMEKLRDIPFPGGVDLQFIIKELARDLDLNVLFDTESFRQPGRKTYIELKNVTPAFALDAIFLQEGLFFQKVGPRTILIANQAQRTKFQQLVLRTFYLANASPKDVAKVVQTAIPPQPGRSQTIVLTDDATNSITIRDTEENIRLIGKLIGSLDKDRAEVVMDVAIYEVNKSDLLEFGNQVGTQEQLQGGLGGSSAGLIRFSSRALQTAAAAGAAASLPTGIATGLILPQSTLYAFQRKDNTKLVASTQIHAFNNEDSSARIGQRVPVRSATFQTGAVQNTGNGGVVSDVINYEQVGLTLKFKPLVFPNQDVQVAMEIESKDVAGAQSLTPNFTERTIKGTARIQNNKTLLLASVAQDQDTNGRSGLPLLGLIPWIGRFFTAPTHEKRQVDIVIAVTPRVIRAPAILPDDEIERPTGSLAVPTNSSLEAMLIEEDRQESLAAIKRMEQAAANAQAQNQAAPAPEFVQASGTASIQQPQPAVNNVNNTTAVSTPVVETAAPNLKPIDNSVKTLQLKETSDTVKPIEVKEVQTAPEPKADQAPPLVSLKIGSDIAIMRAGEKARIPVMIDGTGAFRSAVMGLKFDDKKIAVRSVTFGDMFGSSANSAATPFLNQGGKMYVSLTSREGKDMVPAGTLAFIEIEALADGKPVLAFDRDVLNFLTTDGKNFLVRFQE